MRSRRLRTTVYGLLAVALLAVVVLLGGGWFYAGEIKNGALAVDYDDSPLDMEVVAVGDGRVTLRATPEADKDGDWRSPGTWGLQREEGYDQVGAILELTDRQVVREYIPLTGGLRVGTAVRVDSNAFPGDPLEAHGLAFEDVSFSSPLGEFPAWQVTADTSTWAIFVHGRNSKRGTRRGALRMLPAVAELGITSLIINYRNDEGLPPNPDGYHRFGQTEWADLEGAAEYAVDSGAEKLILVGHSMGGAIVASFLYQSPVAESVVGVVPQCADAGLRRNRRLRGQSTERSGGRAADPRGSYRDGQESRRLSVRHRFRGIGLPQPCRPTSGAGSAVSRRRRQDCSRDDERCPCQGPAGYRGVHTRRRRRPHPLLELGSRRLRGGCNELPARPHRVEDVLVRPT